MAEALSVRLAVPLALTPPLLAERVVPVDAFAPAFPDAGVLPEVVTPVALPLADAGLAVTLVFAFPAADGEVVTFAEPAADAPLPLTAAVALAEPSPVLALAAALVSVVALAPAAASSDPPVVPADALAVGVVLAAVLVLAVVLVLVAAVPDVLTAATATDASARAPAAATATDHSRRDLRMCDLPVSRVVRVADPPRRCRNAHAASDRRVRAG